MKVLRVLIQLAILYSLAMLGNAAFAQQSLVADADSDQLPDIQCTATSCTLNYITSSRRTAPAAPILSADPTPVVVAPPAGQRYLWQGAGYPACQSIAAMDPQPTMAVPYDYIFASDVPVPLGSTHASLLGSMQVNLARGDTGNAADIGMLQIRRSGGAWYNVSISYAYTIMGSNPPQSLYNRATYDGLVNLADLPGGSTVPSLVDVRLAVFPLYTHPPANDVTLNSVCWGTLQVTF